MGRVQLNRYVETLEVSEQDGAGYSPFKLTIAAAERRHRQRLDLPLLVVAFEVVQTIHDVLETADRTPVLLGREVHDQMITGAVDVWFP